MSDFQQSFEQSLAGMTELQQSGLALTQRLQSTMGALPETTSGWDERRTVRVDLSRMAGVVAIEVSHDWERSIEPGELAGAVLEAKQAADALYSEALEQATNDHASAADPVPAASVTDDLLDRVRSYGPTRSVSELAEIALAGTREDAPPAPTERADEWIIDNPKSVELTIEQGILIACRIDERWASSHSAGVINAALAGEIEEAATAHADGIDLGSDDGLVEMLAALMNVTGTAEGRN